MAWAMATRIAIIAREKLAVRASFCFGASRAVCESLSARDMTVDQLVLSVVRVRESVQELNDRYTHDVRKDVYGLEHNWSSVLTI